MSKMIQLNAGTVIFNKGDLEPWFYCVEAGEVSIYSDYHTETEKELTVVRKGQSFGEMGMMDQSPRSATAVARTDVSLLKMEEDDFQAYVAENPQLALAIARQLSGRLRELTEDYREACKVISELYAIDGVRETVSAIETKITEEKEDFFAYVEAEKAEEAAAEAKTLGGWLSKKMKKFADAYRAGGQTTGLYFSL